MASIQLERAVLPDGSIRMIAGSSRFEFARPTPRVLVMSFAGYDKGQFGTSPFDEIGAILDVHTPLELFIDARSAIGATVRVSQDWTSYFSQHKQDFTRIHVLAGSKLIELTVGIVRHLSRTDNLIQIYSDSDAFEAELTAATRRG
jgi:hypothetical protein